MIANIKREDEYGNILQEETQQSSKREKKEVKPEISEIESPTKRRLLHSRTLEIS